MVYKFFDKKFSDSGIKNESMSDQKLSEVLHKPILENLIKEKYIHLFWQYLGCRFSRYAIDK